MALILSPKNAAIGGLIIPPLGPIVSPLNAPSSAVAPWQKSLPGLLAWYRADASAVTLNGSNVSAWADQSGNGDTARNATQATGANQPAYNTSNASYNAKPTITFTGTVWLATGTWSVAPSQPLTILVVGNSGGGVNAYFHDNVGTGQVATLEHGDSSGVQILAPTTLSSSVRGNVPAVIYSIFNGGSSKIGVSAKTASVSGAAGANGATGLVIGSYQGHTNQLGGPIAEIIVCSGALSQTNINTAMTNLGAYYNLSIGA